MTRDIDPWDRPSMDMKVRPTEVVRDVGRQDLLIPRGPGKLRMFALTFLGGVSMALLFVWLPLMIAVLATPVGLSSGWLWLSVAIAAGVFWTALFTLAVRESAADRRYAERLHLPG